MIKELGIDLHGVIDSDVALFKELLDKLHVKDGVSVTIISGPPTKEIIGELNELGLIAGVHYDQVYSVVDRLIHKEVDMWKDEKDTWWASDEDWWSAKASICSEHNIDLMIDDKERYGIWFEHIETEFIVYTPYSFFECLLKIGGMV